MEPWSREWVGTYGVAACLWAEFDGTHAGIDHRYPIGLAYLVERL